LVVGYWFRDYDTVMRFKSASLSNPRLRVLVLDPGADSIVSSLVKEHQIRATSLPYYFVQQEEQYISELERQLVLAP
jgi:hypothetical protein